MGIDLSGVGGRREVMGYESDRSWGFSCVGGWRSWDTKANMGIELRGVMGHQSEHGD